MKKIGLILAGVLAALLFTYGSIATLVNKGMTLPGAFLIFFAVVAGGIGIVKLLGKPADEDN